jgi:hypothetical protein
VTSDELDLLYIGVELRKVGVERTDDICKDVITLCRMYRTLRWRIGEIQKLVDQSEERGEHQIIRASRATLHFILTGSLPEDVHIPTVQHGESGESVVETGANKS